MQAAVDALEVGDVDLAVRILLDALEDAPRRVRAVCHVCGAAFEWPGLLDAHFCRRAA
jgi:hypothetical protein